MTAGLSPQRSLELVVVNADPLASVRAEVVLDGLTGSGQAEPPLIWSTCANALASMAG